MADAIIGSSGITANHVSAATHKIAAIAQSAEVVLLQASESRTADEAKAFALAAIHLVQQAGFIADLLSDRCSGMVTVGEAPEWMLPLSWQEGDVELARRD